MDLITMLEETLKPHYRYMLNRDGSLKGEIVGTRRCNLTGCTGIGYIVRWPDGKRTYPCSKGCVDTDSPDTLKIGP